MIKKEFDLDMVKNVLTKIAYKDHFFVSEAHLQTEFIIAAAELYPENNYYPEINPEKEKTIHFDLLIKTKHQKVLIEFKYITREYSEDVDGMHLLVKSHMSLYKRRYDCWKDIERIEYYSKNKNSDIDYGYFILLTNAPSIWNESKRDCLDKDFHINAGEHIAKIKKWDILPKGIKDRIDSIEITNNYTFQYNDFYNSNKQNGEFKSLIVEIGE